MVYIENVLEKLAEKYSKVRREVREVMGGYIIETEFDKAWERGVEEGMEKGENRLAQLIKCLNKDGRTLDISKVTEDIKYRNALYREYSL